jgi:hypothetical protein
MLLLAKNANLLDNGSELAKSLVTEPEEAFLKKLLDSYRNKDIVKERVLLPGFRFELHPYWCNARNDILERMSCLPVNKFISYEHFEEFIRRTANGFMRANLGSAIHIDSDGEKEAVDWNNYERRVLRIFLSSFCAMGIVDLAFRECANPVKKYVKIEPSIEGAGVRLTELGDTLLKMEDDDASESSNY